MSGDFPTLAAGILGRGACRFRVELESVGAPTGPDLDGNLRLAASIPAPPGTVFLTLTGLAWGGWRRR